MENSGYLDNEELKYRYNSKSYEVTTPSNEKEAHLDDANNGSVSKSVLHIQDATSQWYYANKTKLIWAVLIVLAGAYAVFLAYCMYIEFGSEESIRLLWLTAFVIFMIVILKLGVWQKICEYTQPCNDRVSRKVSDGFAWAVGVVVLIAGLIFVIIDAIVITEEPYNLVSLSGIVLYVLLVFVTSAHPAKVNWRTVLWGINLQLLLALLVLRWSVGFSIIQWISNRFVIYINFTDAGARFVFGEAYLAHWFAFKGMPTVVFISSSIAVLYHFGVMQRTIQIIGWILQKPLCTTAAESMAAAGNIFVGNTEAPLMILPMVKDMTKSELHCLMVVGFATIAGSAFGIYIILGARAEYLVAASIMSAPAALGLAKLSYPEVEVSKTTVADVRALYKSPYRNMVEAASSGAIQAITLVANITVNTIAFLSLLEFVNNSLVWLGNRAGLYDPELSFGLICSYLFIPFALTMGVELEYCKKVAEILGIKIFVDLSLAYRMIGDLESNRIAYDDHILNNGNFTHMGSDIVLFHENGSNTTLVNGIVSERSMAITTFALCGFSGIGSIGIVLGALVGMVPERKSDLSQLVIRAIIVGNTASYMTGCFAGLLFQRNA